MKIVPGLVAAVSGAASGIGRALAIDLSQRGVGLTLCDVDQVGLARTADLCAPGVAVTTSVVDVANAEHVYDWAEQSIAEHGQMNLVCNNAGVNLQSSVDDQTTADIEWVMDANFWGVVHGTQAFLPYLRGSGNGHVVNISSVFGLLSIPTQSAYNAAKFGVRGYTDALRMELEMEGAPVSATTIHPGGIKTNIVRNSRAADVEAAARRFDQMARTTPEKAASQIITAVERNRRRALVGPDALLYDIASRLPAAVNQRLVMSLARRTMPNDS